MNGERGRVLPFKGGGKGGGTADPSPANAHWRNEARRLKNRCRELDDENATLLRDRDILRRGFEVMNTLTEGKAESVLQGVSGLGGDEFLEWLVSLTESRVDRGTGRA